MTETCNHCDGEIELPDTIDVLSVICPHCMKPTGVCANCAWHFDANRNCDECPYNNPPKGV